MIAVGDLAPDFKLRELDGEPRTLLELLGRKEVLLVFFKSSCPVCQLTLPYLERFSRQEFMPFQVFGVSQDDSATTKAFMKRFHLTFPMLLDSEDDGYPASNAYGITHVPTMFVVEKDQRISWASSGFSKLDLEALGHRTHQAFFRIDDDVPAFKAG